MAKTMLDVFDDLIVTRSRYYDEFVLSKSQSCKVDTVPKHFLTVQQVILLASGLDARAFRLKWSPGVHVFEVDRKEVLDFKTRRLQQHNVTLPTCAKHTLVDADLTEESWVQKMLDNGISLYT